MAGKRVTLHDVAQAAGVSAMSVSKALNNKAGLSDKTRKNILKVAHALNYQPNLLAKSLRLDESKTLGVVVSDSSEMVVAKILRGIIDRAEECENSVIISNTDGDPNRERRIVEALINKGIDGMLIVASTLTSADDVGWLKSLNTPIVFLMRESGQALLDSVMNDNFDGGYQIARHLLEQGCRNFQFLSLTSISQSGSRRLEGSVHALEAAGIPCRQDSIQHVLPSIEQGYRAMTQLMKSSAECDAVVCGCDLIAIGALEALKDSNIVVPGQLKITGYDDIELAGYLRVPLTTMRQPLYDIGQKGVNLLFERIQFPDMPTQKVILSSTLMIRESTVC